MAKIIMCATPYCYGPTTKLLCVAQKLTCLRPHDQLIYVGNSPGIDLAMMAGFSECLRIEDRDKWNELALFHLSDADLLVSFLEYRALALAENKGVPSIFVDTLAWTRDAPPPYTEFSIDYSYQRFFEPFKMTPAWGKVSLREFGAILPDRSVAHSTNSDQDPGGKLRLLVNLGGLHSPVMLPSADVSYVIWVVELLRCVDTSSWEVVLCLPLYLKEVQVGKYSHVEIKYLCYEDFLGELRSCALLLCVPGLEAILETMFEEKPIVFLPPHNASQVAQLTVYTELNIPLTSLSHLHVRNLVGLNGEPLSTRQVQEANMNAFARESYCTLVTKEFLKMLNYVRQRPMEISRHISNAKKNLVKLGTTGALDLATRIGDILKR